MAVLVVGTVTVKVSAATPPYRSTRETGDFAPTIDGGEMGVIVTSKRIWTIETVPLSVSDADALVTAIEDTPPIACSGDLLGGTINCRGTVTEYRYLTISSGFRIIVTFTLTEQ